MKRFLVAALSATTAAAMFAVFFNAYHEVFAGPYQIGFDYDSMMNRAILFGLLLAGSLGISGALKEGVCNLRIMATGIAYGALFYLGYSYSQHNFSWDWLAIWTAWAGFCSAAVALYLWSFFAPLPKD